MAVCSQRPRRRKGFGTESGMNKNVNVEIAKSSMDKAASPWLWLLLCKRYKHILMRSLLLLKTALRFQGQGWMPEGICTVLLEQQTPQRITLSWKPCNYKRHTGKLRESVGIMSAGTKKK